MSFHACGANVGDDVDIKLPQWVCDAARANPHLTYRDQHGYHNPECLSLWADHVPDLFGRTPLQCYADFMTSFRVREARACAAPRTERACQEVVVAGHRRRFRKQTSRARAMLACELCGVAGLARRSPWWL